MRAYRARLRDGRMCVLVDVDGAVLARLVALGWLLESESADKAAIGRAVAAMIRDIRA
jgi:hypothetical protein